MRYQPRRSLSLCSGRPPSVSPGAWPALRELGEERKTRVFSEQRCLDARRANSVEFSWDVLVFNRISDRLYNGVYTTAQDDTLYMRFRRPLGWFDVAQPALVHFSSEGMVPLTGNPVFMSIAQTQHALVSAISSMRDLPLKKESAFAAETALIRQAEQLAVQGAPVATFTALATVAHAMDMPRLQVFADGEVEIAELKRAGGTNAALAHLVRPC